MARVIKRKPHTKVFQTSIGCFRPPGSHLPHELTQILTTRTCFVQMQGKTRCCSATNFFIKWNFFVNSILLRAVEISLPVLSFPCESPFFVFPSNCIANVGDRLLDVWCRLRKVGANIIQRVRRRRRSKTSERVLPFFDYYSLWSLIFPFSVYKTKVEPWYYFYVNSISRDQLLSKRAYRRFPIWRSCMRAWLNSSRGIKSVWCRTCVCIFDRWKEDTRNVAMPHTPWFKSCVWRELRHLTRWPKMQWGMCVSYETIFNKARFQCRYLFTSYVNSLLLT